MNAKELGYVADVETAHFISADFSKTYSGWRGVLKDADGHTLESGRSYEGSRAKSAARLDAANIKRRFEHHFRCTGRRLEVERREARQRLHEAKKASTERRNALMRERVDMWRTLAMLLERVDMPADIEDHVAAMVDRHRQAVADIEADPRNERGGEPETPAAKARGRRAAAAELAGAQT